MLLTALCLTFIVFILTTLYPNLEKLAKNQGNFRMSDAEVASYLGNRGYTQGKFQNYGEWLGILPGYVIEGTDGKTRGRCSNHGAVVPDAPKYCGVLQGNWGFSSVFKEPVGDVVKTRLALTGKLMFWVMVVMIPGALIIGVLAGMREGSRLDRSLSTGAIVTTATPEYVSGVIFIAIFTSSAVGLKWFKGSATSPWITRHLKTSFCPF
jgi:peptide/nickel transport system permease protein